MVYANMRKFYVLRHKNDRKMRCKCTFSVFFPMCQCRAGGKVKRRDRDGRRIERFPCGSGVDGYMVATGCSLQPEYRVDGERLSGPGRRGAQPVGLGAVVAGRPDSGGVRLKCTASVPGMVMLLLVMVPVLLLVQFEQLRQGSVVLLEQRILQHHHVARAYRRNPVRSAQRDGKTNFSVFFFLLCCS